jgi:hypothetical protein
MTKLNVRLVPKGTAKRKLRLVPKGTAKKGRKVKVTPKRKPSRRRRGRLV